LTYAALGCEGQRMSIDRRIKRRSREHIIRELRWIKMVCVYLSHRFLK
jgi:hypothetical protein